MTRLGWVTGWAVGGALVLTTGNVWGQQPFIYPQKGQSPQQQAQDQGECQAWATQQTGSPTWGHDARPQVEPLLRRAPEMRRQIARDGWRN